MKKYIKNISNKEEETSKSFWNTIKPFITNKGIQANENTTIEVEKNEKIEIKSLHEKVDKKTNGLIRDEKMLLEMFNKHYICIFEKASGLAPKNLGNPLNPKLNQKTIPEITENNRSHSSIVKIKQTVIEKPIFNFPQATTVDMNKIIKPLSPSEATGPDCVPLKIIKTYAKIYAKL